MKKKKSLHLSKKRKRKTNRVSRPVKNMVTNFRTAALNRKIGNRKQMFLTFFSRYYGLGFKTIVKKIIKPFGLPINFRLKYYTDNYENQKTIESVFEKFVFEGSDDSLKMENISEKQRLFIFISYRHLLFMPVRGQRTKTHGKTRRIFRVV